MLLMETYCLLVLLFIFKETNGKQEGNLFGVVFMNNNNEQGVGYNELYISTMAPQASVQISWHNGNETVKIVRGEIHTRKIATNMRTRRGKETKGILLSSSEEIVVNGVNVVSRTTDGFFAVPVTKTSTDFFIPSYISDSQFAVVALEDDTIVDIQEKNKIKQSVNLKRFETYHKSSGSGDLTGTYVNTSKPVAIYSGCSCTNIPPYIGFCDHIVDGVTSVPELSTEYIVPPIGGRKAGYTIKIIATVNNTTALAGHYGTKTLDAGSNWQFDADSSTSSINVTCSKKCLVVQFNKGQDADRVYTDPFMTLVAPLDDYRSIFSWFSILTGGGGKFNNFVSIVVSKGYENGLLFDGLNLNVTWTTVQGDLYSATWFSVTHGRHGVQHLDRSVKMAVYVYGHEHHDSYCFKAGPTGELARLDMCQNVSYCSFHGKCIWENTCSCDDGWSTFDCSLPNCTRVANCSSRGKCVAPDECICDPGWDGISCEEPTCYKVAHCNEHGECISPDTCSCNTGWISPSCGLATCYNKANCSDHGTCVSPDKCQCDSKWTGPFCNIPTCYNVASCSNHGDCISPETCKCNVGWISPSCGLATCYNKANCSNHGACMSPDQCQCNREWTGPFCNIPTCDMVDQCKGRGECVAPDVCECNERYTGPMCGSCKAGFYGEQCLPCPGCIHGHCNKKTALCVCQGENWGGDLCDRCNDNFSGSQCLPVIKLFDIAPTEGPADGGTIIHMYGANFPQGEYICRFGTISTKGTWISNKEVQCISPKHPSGEVMVSLAPSSTGNFTIGVKFQYERVCSPGACGTLFSPARGSCSKGNCLCTKPWFGENCQILGLMPKVSMLAWIDDIPKLEVDEGTEVSIKFNLTEGTPPYQWNIISPPEGMLLDKITGLLQWSNAVVLERIYTFGISCTNSYGTDKKTFNLWVKPAYRATLDQLPLQLKLPGQPILLSGKVHYLENSSPLYQKPVPVSIIVRSKEGTRILETTSFMPSNSFFTRFYPKPSEAGHYEADARHPKLAGFTKQIEWSILGLESDPTTTKVKGYVGDSKRVPITLINTGVDVLSKIKIIPLNIGNALTILASKNNYSDGDCDISTGCPLVTLLLPGTKTILYLNIQASRTIRGSVPISIQSGEGVATQIILQINFQTKSPKLVTSLSEIRESVLRGKLYTFQVNVTNIGLLPASGVHILLPDDRALSVLSFGNGDADEGIDIDIDETKMFILGVMTRFDAHLGTIFGNILIKSRETATQLRYRFAIVSSSFLNVTIFVEDEYTYFAEDKPHVSGAKLRLDNTATHHKLEGVTNKEGTITFIDIPEAYYNIYVTADRHQATSGVIFVTPGKEIIKIFIQRVAVTVSWSVEQVPFQDEYEVKIEADFETNVPIPVVTVEPSDLDMEILERGLMPVVNFKVTNHGLIAAKSLNVSLPAKDSHPFLEFTMEYDVELGDLPANTSITVPMIITVNAKKKQVFESGIQRKKRQVGSHSMSVLEFIYKYLCDIWRHVRMLVPIKSRCPAGQAVPQLTGGGGFAGGNSGGRSVAVGTPVICERLLDLVLKCLVFPLLPPPFCIPIAYISSSSLSDLFMSLAGCLYPPLGIALSVIGCQDAVANIHTPVRSGRRKRSILNQKQMAPLIASQILEMKNYYDLAKLIVNDDRWIGVKNTESWWENAVKPILSDNSEGGDIITHTEATFLNSYRLPDGVNKDMADKLLTRINNTNYNWGRGVLKGSNMVDYQLFNKIKADIIESNSKAIQDGYPDFLAKFQDSISKFKGADKAKNEGVCAKVRIQIQQKVTLTREAFRATLEIDNGEEHPLGNIRVVISIRDSATWENSTQHFAIGEPKLTGVSDVSGSGRIEVDTVGTAEWLIIPYSSAARMQDRDHDVSGTLYYTVGGDDLEVPLYPETITVKPDPKLHLNYFIEKYVKGDDPFTKEVEPAVPFTLGILLTNEGYGAARKLKISSAQPEIIDNEKGLLVSFKIIASQLGLEDMSPSLNVNFGDVLPGETKMARWIMTSSLQGTFSNYSATFQNINPLGDPKLSVMESVNLHGLMRVVRIDRPQDDQLPDFLTTDESSLDGHPEFLYDSEDGTHPHNVSFGEITNIQLQQMRLEIQLVYNNSGWVFFRHQLETDRTLQFLELRRNDGKEINLHNIWMDTFNDKQYIQLIDFYDDLDANSFSYIGFFGVANIHSPKFTQRYVDVNVTENSPVGLEVTHLSAADMDDSQRVTYQMSNSPWINLDNTGLLTLKGSLDRETTDLLVVTVLAVDNGQPAKTGTATVSITVLDQNDNRPSFDLNEYFVDVERDTPTDFNFFNASAKDNDIGDNAKLIYTLEPEDVFRIEPETGQVYRQKQFMQDSYNITCTATDQGVPALHSSITIFIYVVQSNQYKPQFSQTAYMFALKESTLSVPRPVGVVQASDNDTGQTITYEIIEEENIPFMIYGGNGSIMSSGVTDREKQSTYNFTVRASDSGVSPKGQKHADAEVIVHIIDVNDNEPMFRHEHINITVAENTVPTSALARVKATDADIEENGNILKYDLVADSTTEQFFSLIVTQDDAMIQLVRSVDREQYDKFGFLVIATDGGEPTQTGTIQINIEILDQNDNPPMIREQEERIVILTSTPPNTPVHTVNATDKDKDDRLFFSFVENPNGMLSINPESGVVRITGVPKPGETRYRIAVDDGQHSTEMDLVVVVTTSNEFSPKFSMAIYTAIVRPDAQPGTTVLTVVASDQDSAVITYSIIDGNKDNVFAIGITSGTITVEGKLRSNQRKYLLIVQATDDGENGNNKKSSTAQIVIIVIPINRYNPEFTGGHQHEVSIVENMDPPVTILQILATDDDGDGIKFSLVTEDTDLFEIDQNDGTLKANVILDYEEKNMYIVEVVATDTGSPTRSSTAMVTIRVLDENEAPVILNTERKVFMNEKPEKGLEVYKMQATDPDSGRNGELRYKIWWTTGSLVIDENTGVITLAVDTVTAKRYLLVAYVVDGGSPPKLDFITVWIYFSG